jgi:hypothetical protein
MSSQVSQSWDVSVAAVSRWPTELDRILESPLFASRSARGSSSSSCLSRSPRYNELQEESALDNQKARIQTGDQVLTAGHLSFGARPERHCLRWVRSSVAGRPRR